MESQPQNPEFRINPENFHLCQYAFTKWIKTAADLDTHCFFGLCFLILN